MSKELETEVTEFVEVLPESVAEKQTNYLHMKDAELMEVMRSKGLRPPLNEDGRMIRRESLAMLRDSDEKAAVDEKRKRRVRVVFHNSPEVSAGKYVFASVNDRNFQAPYDTEVIIPEYMLDECINRAVITVNKPYSVQNSDGSYTNRFKKEQYRIYPYTKLGYVD